MIFETTKGVTLSGYYVCRWELVFNCCRVNEAVEKERETEVEIASGREWQG